MYLLKSAAYVAFVEFKSESDVYYFDPPPNHYFPPVPATPPCETFSLRALLFVLLELHVVLINIWRSTASLKVNVKVPLLVT